MMRVKVCGITNPEDAVLCEHHGADALGFIFYPRSKRYISPSQAADIIAHLSPFIVKVGVFVNEDPDHINKMALQIGLNCAQLHGEEPPTYIEKINFPVIKSFRVDREFDYSVLNHYTGCSFLLDVYSSKGYGGTGRSFDWHRIPGSLRRNIILAGGISADNMEEIFNKITPNAIDLSSSLESYPGKKDPVKTREFFDKFKVLKKKYNGR
jgi:phosphoribosylanthranilate isomerase